MKILVINLMRFGDIIQSEPLLRGLKKRCPGAKIHLLVYSSFASATEIISHFDRVHVINLARMYELANNEKEALPSVFAYLIDLFHKLRAERFDLIVNITPSNIGSLTAALCRGREIYGGYINQKGLRVINNPWARYFYMVGEVRNCNNINLVDLFMREGRLNTSPGPLKVKVDEARSKDMQKLLDEKARYRVALHLGASREKRSWPPENFAEAAGILKRELDVQFILLGTPQEKVLAERFLRYFSPDCLNLVGKTDLKGLAAILSRADLLICNDTGPMHVACGVATRVVSIFLATANPHETGPYGTGHLVIEPDIPCHPCDHEVECRHYSCHNKVSPATVAGVVRSALTGSPLSLSALQDVRLYRSEFGDDGMLELNPLRQINWSMDGLVMLLWRGFWPPYLAGKDGGEKLIERLEKKLGQYFGDKALKEAGTAITRQVDTLNELIFLAASGEYYCRRLMEGISRTDPDFTLISSWAGMLREIDDYIKGWGCRNPSWRGLTQFFLLEKLSMGEGNIEELAGNTRLCYTRLKDQTLGFRNLIKKLLGKESHYDFRNKDGREGDRDSLFYKQPGGATFASHGH